MKAKIFAMLAAAFACLTLTCCHEDPEPDPTPDPESAYGEDENPDTNDDPEQDVKPRKWIIAEYGYASDPDNFFVVDSDEDGRPLNFTYYQDKIIKDEFIYHLEDDRIVRWDIGGVTEHTYKYDNTGHLIELAFYDAMASDHVEPCSYHPDCLNWENGLILTIDSHYDDLEFDSESDDITLIPQITTSQVSYYSKNDINSDCISVMNSAAISEFTDMSDRRLAIAGYYGKMPEKLITEISENELHKRYKLNILAVDEHGCPTLVLKISPNSILEETTYILKWKQI